MGGHRSHRGLTPFFQFLPKITYPNLTVSQLPPKLVPLLVRAAFGGRRRRSSSHHRSTFHFPFVLSLFYTAGFISQITCSLFNPLFPFVFCLFGLLLWARYYDMLVEYLSKVTCATHLCCPAPDSSAPATARPLQGHISAVLTPLHQPHPDHYRDTSLLS